jgi:mxaD protein
MAAFRPSGRRAAFCEVPGTLPDLPTEKDQKMSHINDAANEGLESPDMKKGSATHVVSGAASIRSLGVGLLMAGSAAGALAGTLSVSEEVELTASPARTWAVIKDFQRWQTWHPAFVTTEIIKGGGNAKGTVRILAAKDGARFNEELLMHDAAARSYQYRIIDSPLPISDYVSTIEVKESKLGSRVVWSSNFSVNPGVSDELMKKTIAGVYRAGLDSLKERVN